MFTRIWKITGDVIVYAILGLIFFGGIITVTTQVYSKTPTTTTCSVTYNDEFQRDLLRELHEHNKLLREQNIILENINNNLKKR